MQIFMSIHWFLSLSLCPPTPPLLPQGLPMWPGTPSIGEWGFKCLAVSCLCLCLGSAGAIGGRFTVHSFFSLSERCPLYQGGILSMMFTSPTFILVVCGLGPIVENCHRAHSTRAAVADPVFTSHASTWSEFRAMEVKSSPMVLMRTPSAWHISSEGFSPFKSVAPSYKSWCMVGGGSARL